MLLKGPGRAQHGSVSNSIWLHRGPTHGPLVVFYFSWNLEESLFQVAESCNNSPFKKQWGKKTQ
jgi:hypothetical protein